MTTGKPTFHGKTSAVIFKAILDETPVALSQRNLILPERLDDVVSKAPAELRADLQRLKRDSESGKMTIHPSPRRSSARLAGAAGFILVLLAAAAFGIISIWDVGACPGQRLGTPDIFHRFRGIPRPFSRRAHLGLHKGQRHLSWQR